MRGILRVIRPRAIAPAVIAAWEQAGAVFGWTSVGPQGDWQFDREAPPAGALPAFQLSRFPAGKVRALAPPEVPFGLWFGRGVQDADLPEIAREHLVGGQPVERLRYRPGKPGPNVIDRAKA